MKNKIKCLLKSAFLTLATSAIIPFAGAQIMNTKAGNGNAGYSGDGGMATAAEIYNPTGITIDNWGNLYFADNSNNCIRKVDTNGVISTVAGNGSSGYFGDGFAATQASLNAPSDVVVDAVGNIYIADAGNGRIRMVNTNGIISTYAGAGTPGFSGDNGPALNAQFASLSFLSIDNNGNLYITDNDNNRIRKINTTTGIITTIVGSGAQGHSGDGGPATNAKIAGVLGLTVDLNGNLYFTEQDNQYIRKVSANGTITTIAGNGSAGHSGDGGAAINASFNNPSGLAIDAEGNMYISELFSQCVRKISNTGIISTIAGDGNAAFGGDGTIATSASLYGPQDVTVDGKGNLYISDYFNNRIRFVTCTPTVPSVAITSSVNGAVAAGTMVTFTANATNAGINPTYQWKKNGINVGTNNNTYTTNSLQSTDTITCILHSSALCVIQNNVPSNPVGLIMLPTGINSITGTDGTIVYPNPATDAIFIANLSYSTPYRLLNMLGTELMNGELDGTHNRINIQSLPLGSYMLYYKDRNGVANMIRIQK